MFTCIYHRSSHVHLYIARRTQRSKIAKFERHFFQISVLFKIIAVIRLHFHVQSASLQCIFEAVSFNVLSDYSKDNNPENGCFVSKPTFIWSETLFLLPWRTAWTFHLPHAFTSNLWSQNSPNRILVILVATCKISKAHLTISL